MIEHNGKERLMTLEDVETASSEEITKMSRENLNKGMTELLCSMGCANVLTKAQGCRIWDNNKEEYLDFIGAYGAMSLGNCNKDIIEAIHKVEDKINLTYIGLNPYEAVFAYDLVVMTKSQLERVFFCNSGSEAIESALKMARAATGKKRIIYCKNSYHGKSVGALSVTGREHYRKSFEPLMPEVCEVPFDQLTALEDQIKLGAAAFVVEPIQGEGGIIVPSDGYFKEVRRLCDQYQVLLIMDEIQTGLGRTGTLFAYESYDIVPDILCLAKSLGGGIIPVGACLSKEEVYEKAYGDIERCTLHSSTFGGNTYACAAGIAALHVIEKENLVDTCRQKGDYLKTELERIKTAYKGIKEVRGKGLMIGIEFEETSDEEGLNSIATSVAVNLVKKYHILTAYSTNNMNVIRLEPPLTISYEEINRLLVALKEILVKKQ